MLWHIQTINMRPLIWGKEYKKQPCNLLLTCAPCSLKSGWGLSSNCAVGAPWLGAWPVETCSELSIHLLLRRRRRFRVRSPRRVSDPPQAHAIQLLWIHYHDNLGIAIVGAKDNRIYVSRQVFWCLGMNGRVRESTRRRFSSNQTEECGARERLHLQQDLRLIFAKNICIVYAKWSATSTNTEADFLQIRLPCNGLL